MRRRGTFTPGESTHTHTQSLPHPSSAQPTVDSRRRLARGVTRSGGLRSSTLWRSCTDQGTAAKVRVWLAARLLSEGRGLSHTGRVERRVRKAGAGASARTLFEKRSPRVEAGEDRTLEVVLARHLMLLQKSTDSGRRTEADAPPFHPIWKRSGTGA